MSLRRSTCSRLIPNKYITHDIEFYQERTKSRKPAVFLSSSIVLNISEDELTSYNNLYHIYSLLMGLTFDTDTDSNLRYGIPLRVMNTWG